MYPLASPEGSYIPSDVIGVLGTVVISANGSTQTISELVDADILAIYADGPTFLQFDGQAALPPSPGTYAPNQVFVCEYTVGKVFYLDVRNLLDGMWDGSISAISELSSALVYINNLVRYQHLRTPFRVGRR